MNVRLLFVLLIGLYLCLLPALAVAQSTGDTPVSGPASPIQRNNGGQLTISGFIVLMLDWLKKNPKFSWLTQDTETRNRIVALIASGLAAIAVHATFDHNAGTLMITGLTVTGITTAGVAWAKSFIYQQLIFKMSRT